FTEAEKTEAWSRTTETVKKYSDEMIERWNTELDTDLVYAALFSAILTAFNVQSYQLLQPSPQTDPTLAILQQISAQLNSFSVNPPFVNATQQAFAQVNIPPAVTAPAPLSIALNALWFSGLVVSLSAASVAITVKQWLHEYRAGISGNSLEIARLRQRRLDNLMKWHVAEIVAFIPVLLQVSLVLFFAGLVILLWTLHSGVAVAVTCLIGNVFIFLVGTTLLPVWRHDCCYLSP
ncbi:hypothetical protein L226DRAFT_426070, partial [Lentinus tigrinus ALCF2SS1-7]|uniref:uncharacterized protein n=1 Tax=Lentinus tigrinus ALCF2SS1-7 TaxID=1328758 RepID=UPI001165EFE8